MGAALASCILTTMAIVAERDGVKLEGARAETEKRNDSRAPAGRLAPDQDPLCPPSIPAEYRKKLENAAEHCPVKKSLFPEVDTSLTFVYR